ncbi:MAG: hypothetical protein A2X94_07965 [Bdellovibrionales bacterium GWB1_55_8]|nr:MAG: hypothetical protein A2X94_07965 [Bdellovibrionales bacterium GWB1_55_8]
MTHTHGRRFSIIIPAKESGVAHASLTTLRAINWPGSDYEVLLATGNNPSRQRNEAWKRARGEYLLFLDDDSEVSPDLLMRYSDAIDSFPDAAVYGGPSVYYSKTGGFTAAVQLLFLSRFALGPVSARYRPSGPIRQTNERELILCNLVVRRDLIEKEGGFDERLYPNEENEFLNRVIRESERIIYTPNAVVARQPRSNIFQFILQVYRYGRGRARHYRLRPRFFDLIFALPALFSLYVTGLVLRTVSGFAPDPWSLPLVVYGLLVLAQGLLALFRGKPVTAALGLPALIFICHFFYGIGVLFGVVIHPGSFSRAQVHLYLLKAFDDPEWRESPVPYEFAPADTDVCDRLEDRGVDEKALFGR